MQIIDAHLHFCPESQDFTKIAKKAGHLNTQAHLSKQYKALHIVHGVVMGNHGLSLDEHNYPDFLSYCIGLDSHSMQKHTIQDSVSLLEQHLRRPQCVGIKLYPGYSPAYVTDAQYAPVYELAEQYGKPVAIHTGETASRASILKYSHPLTLDELAVRHPQVQFIMCHFGNPWLADAAAVLSKNENVAADLSGLLEGRVMLDTLFLEQSGYLQLIKTWITYLNRFDALLFGTDWPLVHLSEYIAFIARLVPEKHHHNIFFDNANQIYQLGLPNVSAEK